MSRPCLVLIALAVGVVSLADSALAQSRPSTEGGLRRLTWPGHPGQDATAVEPTAVTPAPPPRLDRPAPVAPSPLLTATAENRLPPAPVVPLPPMQPVTTPTPTPTPVSTPEPTTETPAGTTPAEAPRVRYYSLHRERGIRPDPMPEAQERAAEEVMVELEAPSGPSLAEEDRLAAGIERLRLLEDLPPERLAALVEALR